MKSPPVQYHDDDARDQVEEFIKKNGRKKIAAKQPAKIEAEAV
jgi:hypothetical protein